MPGAVPDAPQETPRRPPHSINVLDPAVLRSAQNPDGGWGYRTGAPSVTEATALASLALSGENSNADALDRAAQWIKTRQRSDGGWAPREGVDQSTWVTALPLFLPARMAAAIDTGRATEWLLSQTGRESGWVYRLRLFLLGGDSGSNDSYTGWPWYPDTAAWVIPTALTLLALEKVRRRAPAAFATAIDARCSQARSYLLARRCADGGWNHGSTRALGYDGPSYPETTGLALLALHGETGLESSLNRAQAHGAGFKSLEAASWLRLGLASHGKTLAEPAADLPARTNLDLALGLIAQSGRNAFLDQA